MLPPIQQADYELSSPAEPELLTHREDLAPGHDPEAERRINALLGEDKAGAAVGAEGFGDDGEPPGEPPEDGKKRRSRRIKRALFAFVGIFFVLPLVAFTVAYFFVDVPSPHEIASEQSKTVTYTYSDGSVMGQDSQDGNREMLKPEDVPDTIKHAVYAAEDATFETNSGFDVTGILRAAKNQLSGGVGGGSTITQQYIKKATENEERTLTRKGLEIVKAFKMSNTLEKSEIITAYLNTIYFGRGAYGVQAASHAYFDKDVKELSPSEAAYLAGIIQAPSRGDNPEYAEGRWDYVIEQMSKHNWLSGDERQQAEFPETISPKKAQLKGFSGPKRFIKNRIEQELDDLGFPEEQVRLSGYQIHTTIDKRAQDLAEKTVKDVMEGEPENLKEALVAVDPKSGGIRAYYGGAFDANDQRDWANTPRNPGSVIKAFDFVGLLKQDKGPYSVYDGTAPRTFPGDTEPIHNSEGDQCPNCTVMEAMKRSINTVFYDMVVNDVKPSGVAKAAREAGVSDRSKLDDRLNNIAIGGGSTEITPRDMATAYATFAAEGMRHDSHFVEKITTPEGDVVFEADGKGEPAFDKKAEESKQIAGNVTMALKQVPGYSQRPCPANQECAGKTGTHQYEPPEGEPDNGDNSQAWMAGYTKHISVAAWVGSDKNEAIKDMNGAKIYGRGLPGAIWKQFMDAYHEGKPNEPFDKVEVIGKAQAPPPTTQAPPENDAPANNPETTEPSEEESEKPSDKPDKPDKPEDEPSEEPGRPPPTDGEPQPPPDDGEDGDGDDGGGGIWPDGGDEE